MLQTRFRFHGYSGLKYLYKQGRTVRGRSLAIRYVMNTRRSDSRAAVIVTKKVFKSAPKRNRIRRRIYEVLRTNWPRIAPGHDILVTGYEPLLLDIPSDELKTMLIDLLRQAKLWGDGEDTPPDSKPVV